MEKNLIDRIDWVAYRKNVEADISNNRLWCMGAGQDAELHEENIEELEEELENILEGNYQTIIDKHVKYMGEEDAVNYFMDFFKDQELVQNKAISKKENNELLLDALADIAMYAGWQHLEFDDSKQRSITLQGWAQEFVEKHAETDWKENDYINLVDKFAEEKIAKWVRMHPMQPSYAERITDINIYSGKSGGMFIRCKIDGEQQTAERMSFADTVKLNDNTDRLELAAKYFKNALQPEQSHTRGFNR